MAVVAVGEARLGQVPFRRGSGLRGRPTIWLDDTTGDLIIQSWIADEETVKAAQRVGSIPGHSTDVPSHETVIRLPADMVQFIPRPH
jgi:hypothetical protein